MKRLLACLAASVLVVGCSTAKKMPEPNPMTDAATAPQPVAYQPTAPAPAPVVSTTPVAETASVTTGAPAAASPAVGGSASSSSSSSITGHKYTLKKGDNLYTIAKKKYGNGNDYKKILAANPGLNENRLVPGKTITLP